MAVHRWMQPRCGRVVRRTLPSASFTVSGRVWSCLGTGVDEEWMILALTSFTYPGFKADWFARKASCANGTLCVLRYRHRGQTTVAPASADERAKPQVESTTAPSHAALFSRCFSISKVVQDARMRSRLLVALVTNRFRE